MFTIQGPLAPEVEQHMARRLPPLRHALRAGERRAAVRFVETFLPYHSGEVAGFPREECERLIWLGVARPLGFDASLPGGLAEQRRRLAGG